MIEGLFDPPVYTPAKLAVDYQRVLAAKAAEYSGALTNAALFKLVVGDLERANKFVWAVDGGVGLAWPEERQHRIRQIVAELQAVRNASKVAYANAPGARADGALVARARAAALAPLEWLLGVASKTLADSNAAAQWARDLIASPRELLANFLGLPSWFVPVSVAVVGLVALAHVSGALRTFFPAPAGR